MTGDRNKNKKTATLLCVLKLFGAAKTTAIKSKSKVKRPRPPKEKRPFKLRTFGSTIGSINQQRKSFTFSNNFEKLLLYMYVCINTHGNFLSVFLFFSFFFFFFSLLLLYEPMNPHKLLYLCPPLYYAFCTLKFKLSSLIKFTPF